MEPNDNCIKCEYHRIAFSDNAQFSEASKKYNGYVNIYDTNIIYDEKGNVQPRGEYRIDDEYEDFCSKKRHILELKKYIKETKTPKECEHINTEISEEISRNFSSEEKRSEDINVKLKIQVLTETILSRYVK